MAADPETSFTRMPDISVVEQRQPYPKQRNCTSGVFVICCLDACFQIQYLHKFLAIWIHLAQKSLNIRQCSCALAFKCRLKKEFQSAEKYFTGSGFDLNGFWMHIHLGGWTSCHSLSHLLLRRVKMTMKLYLQITSQPQDQLPFNHTCNPACLWTDTKLSLTTACVQFEMLRLNKGSKVTFLA